MRLGRAPREVYRVYNEREFFADGAHEERLEVERAVAGGRRLQRLAGVTVLLAAVGAAGGLIVVASLPSRAGGRRRGGSRLAADVASPTRASMPSWRQQPRAQRLTAATGGASALKPAAGAVHAERQHSAPGAAGRRRAGSERVVGAVREQAAASVELAASAADTSRAAVVATRPSGQIEFGFER
jgi:hypothetical protein